MNNSTGFIDKPIPARAGIGLRSPHYQAILTSLPDIAWLEVHSENYFHTGSNAKRILTDIRNHYPISLHGVGLSLGSTDPLDITHLKKLKNLISDIAPALVSEHLAWISVDQRYFNDLLPLPYTEEALQHLVGRINTVQDYLQRPILIENISSYLQYKHSTIPEWEFLTAVAAQSGCQLLLDINNIYVNSCNHQFDPFVYLSNIPQATIAEIHLAGFSRQSVNAQEILIDTHDQPIAAAVWELYQHAITRYGNKPTLIEWDSNIPSLQTLLNEAGKANHIMEQNHVCIA